MLMLIKRLEDVSQEQAYLKNLKDQVNDQDAAEQDLKELEQRIAEEISGGAPGDAARYYYSIANLTKTEFKSLKTKYA